MIKIAIIGGTGVYDPSMLTNLSEQTVTTPYGDVTFKTGDYNGKTVAFIPRHGSKHSIPPHLINYRANIWAMKKIGVEHIVATTAVGSLNRDMKPGDFVIVDQFLDFTKSRVTSFYEGGWRGVAHLDVTEPYCPYLRNIVKEASEELGISVHETGTYVCTEGPRFESPAEIKMFERLGGDLVGMTNIPEATLAREAEMCYSTVSMVTNFAAGISPTPLTHGEVVETMAQNAENIKRLIMKTIDMIDISHTECLCRNAMREYGRFRLEEE